MNPKYKKLLAVAVLIPVVGMAGYGAYNFTSALFSDTETNTTNSFAAGTLNMTVGGNDGTAFDNFSITDLGESGVVSGSKEWTITNSGSVPGNLTFRLNSVTNTENGCNEPEIVTEPACEDDTDGELGNFVTTTVLVDADNNGTYERSMVSSTLATANQGQYASQWNSDVSSNGPVLIPEGRSVKVKMTWATDPAVYDNSIQSDTLSFGIQYDLTQVVPTNNTPTPTP